MRKNLEEKVLRKIEIFLKKNNFAFKTKVKFWEKSFVKTFTSKNRKKKKKEKSAATPKAHRRHRWR